MFMSLVIREQFAITGRMMAIWRTLFYLFCGSILFAGVLSRTRKLSEVADVFASTLPHGSCSNSSCAVPVDVRSNKRIRSDVNIPALHSGLGFTGEAGTSGAHGKKNSQKKPKIVTATDLSSSEQANSVASAVVTYGQAAYQRKRRVHGLLCDYT